MDASILPKKETTINHWCGKTGGTPTFMQAAAIIFTECKKMCGVKRRRQGVGFLLDVSASGATIRPGATPALRWGHLLPSPRVDFFFAAVAHAPLLG